MNYYITINEDFIYQEAVLTNSGEFKIIEDRNIQDIEDVKLFSSYSSAENSITGKIINYKGDKIKAFPDPEEITGTTNRKSIDIESFRTKKPTKPLFTKSDLKNVIANGNDQENNMIVIDEDGSLLLAQGHFPKLDYPVKNLESFSAGNDYVGIKAAQDESFIQEQYLGLLSGWEEHLESNGSMTLASINDVTKDEDSMIKNINKLIEEKYK